MQLLKIHISHQLAINRGKNLYHKDLNSLFSFMNITTPVHKNLMELDKNQQNQLVDFVTELVLEELYKANQYYAFSHQAIQELRNYYSMLLTATIKGELQDNVTQQHYYRLQSWLQKSNPFSAKINHPDKQRIDKVYCEEYSPELQLQHLQIDLNNLAQPVLDIGCGRNASMVKHLRNLGITAFGIDRMESKLPYCKKLDWLEYDYGTNKWGTIISNLGFSNHFIHHHLRNDGNYLEYARKYLSVLNSLKSGGSFYYAPALPFIEKHLDDNEYTVKKFLIEGTLFRSAIITKSKN